MNNTKINKLMKVILAGSILVSTFSVFQKFGIDPFFYFYDTNIFDGRVFSTLGNPSYLGQYMSFSVLISFFYAVQESTKSKKIQYLGMSLLFISTILLSQTRTAILGILFAVLLLCIKYRTYIFAFLNKFKYFFAVTFIIFGLFFSQNINDRFSFSNHSFRSLESRFQIWNGAIKLISKKPFLGYGEETFYIYFPEVVTEEFASLEENINLSADRVHNETLEIFFNHGIFGLLTYILLFIYLLRIFIKADNSTVTLLSLITIVNIIQNQLAFTDVSIAVLISFAYGALISYEIKDSQIQTIKIPRLVTFISLILFIWVSQVSIYNKYATQYYYSQFRYQLSQNYDLAVNYIKKSLDYTPYYSELWFELIFIDESSHLKALNYINKIEGDSGNYLVWMGNFYKKSNPRLSSQYFLKALKKNPYHPNWIRAFADMLYFNEDYKTALYLYNKYLEAIPDLWEYDGNLEDLNKRELEKYETFLKYTPYFPEIIQKMKKINQILESQEQSN